MGDLGGGDLLGGMGGGDMFGGGDAFGMAGDPFSDPSMFDPSMMGSDFSGGMGVNDLMGSFGGTSGVTPSGSPVDVASNPAQAQAQAGDLGDQLGVNDIGGQQQSDQAQASQNPAQPQQGGMLDYLRNLNPVGSANAAEAFTPGGGANFSDRFGDFSQFNTGQNVPTSMAQRGGMLPPAVDPDAGTARQGLQMIQAGQGTPTGDLASPDVAPAAPDAGGPPVTPVTGVAPASQTVIPGAQPGGDAGADVPGTTPDRPGTPDSGQPGGGGGQGGQPGQGDGQGDQRGRGGRGGQLEQLLRQMGLPGSLAHLAAMAMAQRMFPRTFPFPGRFPGRFPGFGRFGRGGRFGGGFPGMGRGGRGGIMPGMRVGPGGGPGPRGWPGMSMRSPLTRMRPGVPWQGGGGMPFPFQGGGDQDGGQPPQDGGASGDPGSAAGASPSAPPRDETGALIRPGDAGQQPGQQQQQAQPFQVAAGGRSAGGVPLSTISLPGGRNVRVASEAAPAFRGFLQDLAAAGAPLDDIGGYNYRNIAGTNQLSQHASGRAIDVNQRGRNVVSPAFQQWARANADVLRQLTRKYGLVSGGDWRNPDFGHWEMRRREYALNNPVEAFTHGLG